MVKLIIDLGNTQSKLALFRDKKLVKEYVFSTITVKNLKAIFHSYPTIEASILSSVIRHPSSIEKFLSSKAKLVRLTPATPLPVKNRYKTPRTLGCDRIASAVGASVLFPRKNVLVVDAGTCIKYNFINSRGEFCGGGISPGIEIRFYSLYTFTGKLPLIRREKSKRLVGQTTKESILSGVMQGALSEVAGVISQYKKKYPGLKVILTGGDSMFFEKKLKNGIFAAPHTVLTGLNSILDFNLS